MASPARERRRGAKGDPVGGEVASVTPSAHLPLPAEVAEGGRRLSGECWEGRGDVYNCPTCGGAFEAGQFWIQCDVCKEWFHGDCAHVLEYQVQEIDRFHCKQCEETTGPSVRRPVTNSHRHDRTEADPEGKPVQAGTKRFVQWLEEHSHEFAKGEDIVVRMRGQQLSLPVLLKKRFDVPILVDSKEGLEMTVPPEDFSVEDVMGRIGTDYELDVIDVNRQFSVKMPFSEFARHLNQEKGNRTSVYNCISLEVSKTVLGEHIKAPGIVNKLSWVEHCWPNFDFKPAVSKYCLMSEADSFTDFHIDFGGTSVWYHVLRGEKVFYFIEPSPENLRHYESWMNQRNHSEVFFGDLVEKCYKLRLTVGQTLLIPTGWIHAVFTPRDSLVFGGNFLHSLNISLQLAIFEIENRIKTPDKFQFPFFELTHWYAAPSVLKLLQDNLNDKIPPKFLVEGVKDLVSALKRWLNTSKQENSQQNEDYSLLAPKGINCTKLIKDLNKELKKAEKLLEGQPARRPSYKPFDLPQESQPSLVETVAVAETGDLNSSLVTPKGSSKAKELGVRKEEMETEEESNLVVDEKLRAEKRQRGSSTESESKGSIRMKLTLSGKSGLPEVMEAPTLMPPAQATTPYTSDSNQVAQGSEPRGVEDAIQGMLSMSSSPMQRTGLAISANLSERLHSQKKKAKLAEHPEDKEIEKMIEGCPQDAQFIYLDVETQADDERPFNINPNRGGPKDDSWTPRQRVVIKGTPKAARPPRDKAKREVIESTLAKAAANLEHQPQPKRTYKKKKPKQLKASASLSPEATSPDQLAESNILPLLNEGLGMVMVPEPQPGPSLECPLNALLTEDNSKKYTNTNDSKRKNKKGFATAKQRLAKTMRLKLGKSNRC